jgi:hypothetical protein
MRRFVPLVVLTSVAACTPIEAIGFCGRQPDHPYCQPDGGGLDAFTDDAPAIDEGADAVVEVEPLPTPDGTTACDARKSPAEDVCVLGDQFGVFVAAVRGDDASAGTRAAPVRTWAKALSLLTTRAIKRVYACLETDTGGKVVPFTEALAAPSGVQVFGGIDCVGGRVSSLRTVVAPSTGIPLVISGTSDVAIDGFEFVAANAAAGADSIAARISKATRVLLKNFEVRAGRGGDGAAGAAGTDGRTGERGSAGAQGGKCDASWTSQLPRFGAAGASSFVEGGRGGNGSCSTGSVGEPGKPPPRVAANAPADCGAGGPTNDRPLAISRAGRDGCPGASGALGAAATSTAAFNEAGEYTPSIGRDGAAGSHGGGGGGGGTGPGLLGGLDNKDPGVTYASAGGGGGAGGGEAGAGGRGGRSGGASIALLIIDADVTLLDWHATAGSGGAGGAGGRGGAGGDGGAWTQTDGGGGHWGGPGGRGGKGGDGGAGGGGAGGPSIGIAYRGKRPVFEGDLSSLIKLGPGGAGGDSPGNKGPTGVQKLEHAF